MLQRRLVYPSLEAVGRSRDDISNRGQAHSNACGIPVNVFSLTRAKPNPALVWVAGATLGHAPSKRWHVLGHVLSMHQSDFSDYSVLAPASFWTKKFVFNQLWNIYKHNIFKNLFKLFFTAKMFF
jgi:hypothetical protein